MTTQEEMEIKNMSLVDLLKLSIDLLEKPDHHDLNLGMAQNLISQAFFKYLDLADCPFKDVCREDAYENEPEPIDIRGEID